jgi:hypothetical protein
MYSFLGISDSWILRRRVSEKDCQRPKIKSLSSLSVIIDLIDPSAHMERAILELDSICLAAAEKLDGVLVDERHVLQIQNQLSSTCLDREQLLKLLDIFRCFDPAAECELNSTIPFSPSP